MAPEPETEFVYSLGTKVFRPTHYIKTLIRLWQTKETEHFSLVTFAHNQDARAGLQYLIEQLPHYVADRVDPHPSDALITNTNPKFNVDQQTYADGKSLLTLFRGLNDTGFENELLHRQKVWALLTVAERLESSLQRLEDEVRVKEGGHDEITKLGGGIQRNSEALGGVVANAMKDANAALKCFAERNL